MIFELECDYRDYKDAPANLTKDHQLGCYSGIFVDFTKPADLVYMEMALSLRDPNGPYVKHGGFSYDDSDESPAFQITDYSDGGHDWFVEIADKFAEYAENASFTVSVKTDVQFEAKSMRAARAHVKKLTRGWKHQFALADVTSDPWSVWEDDND